MMTLLASHPSLWLFAGAAAALLVGRRLPAAWTGIGFAIAALVAVVRLPPATLHAELAGFPLVWLRVDDLSRLFALVFGIVALTGLLYGAHRLRPTETAAAMSYAGAAIATVFAGDWITFFVFWELMAITSLVLIWHGGAGAKPAGMRYLLAHAAGGALLFFGIALHRGTGGALELAPLEGGAAFWLVLAGVAVNAAIPPLHAWLTDAYPEASTTGAVFLSACTTKTAVYALVRLFPETGILVPLGVAMALYGALFALMENDIRRLLGYHIVSQVGYMVAGVGIGTSLALNGSVAHAYSHILYKALLFMGAGAAIEATGGRRRLSDLGGIAPGMRWGVALYLVGALSISGAPLFNGFISKSMIVSAAAEGHFALTELLLTLAAVGTFLSVGLKLPRFAFFGAPKGIAVRRLPGTMLAAMGILAGLCFLYGVRPGLLYRLLPFGGEAYKPWTVDHVVGGTGLLVGAAILFLLWLPRLAPSPRITVDVDWLYRGRPFRSAGRAANAVLTAVPSVLTLLRERAVRGLARGAARIAFGDHAPSDGRPFPRGIGWTLLLAALAASVLLLLLTLR